MGTVRPADEAFGSFDGMNIRKIKDQINRELSGKKLGEDLGKRLGMPANTPYIDLLEGPMSPIVPGRADRISTPSVRWVSIYPVRGGSEGWWIHVDLIYGAHDGIDLERLGMDPDRIMVLASETVLTSKTFAGRTAAVAIASYLADWELRTESILDAACSDEDRPAPSP